MTRGYEQYSLFGGFPPHQPTDTSVAAADQIIPDINRLRALALRTIRNAGEHGVTDEEGIERCGMPANTWRPRRRELVLLEMVEDSGQRRTTASGRSAIVWVGT